MRGRVVVMRSRVEGFQLDLQEAMGSSPVVVAKKHGGGGGMRVTYECLPDTVDPHGPKGK